MRNIIIGILVYLLPLNLVRAGTLSPYKHIYNMRELQAADNTACIDIRSNVRQCTIMINALKPMELMNSKCVMGKQQYTVTTSTEQANSHTNTHEHEVGVKGTIAWGGPKGSPFPRYQVELSYKFTVTTSDYVSHKYTEVKSSTKIIPPCMKRYRVQQPVNHQIVDCVKSEFCHLGKKCKWGCVARGEFVTWVEGEEDEFCNESDFKSKSVMNGCKSYMKREWGVDMAKDRYSDLI
jgi:hypothetical protein